MSLDTGAAVEIAIGPPGHAIYTAGDESLVCSVMNALAGVRVRIAGRFMHMDGRVEPIVDTFTPATDRSVSVKRIALARGWLLHAQVSVVVGAPLTAQTFAILSLVRGRTGAFEELATLVAGPVTAVQRLAWPGSLVGNSLEGAGALRTIVGTIPAAGAEVSETVPTGARWELVSLKLNLTTSATVATRAVQLVFTVSASVLFQVGAVSTQPATTTALHDWFQGGPLPGLDISGNKLAPLPVGLRLPGGATITTVTSSIQVGDQYAAPVMLVREWIEGA
jgi:hypothetical protein